jgi:hypothetical protein
MSADSKVIAFSADGPSSDGAQPEDAKLDRLFDDVYEFSARYVGWTDEFRTGASAWSMASWIYRRFDSFPYLQFVGPPGRGKSRSCRVVAAMAYEPFECACATAAVIYRKASQGVTLIIDEVDESLSGDIRKILRFGFSKGGRIPRCRTITRHTEKSDVTDYDVSSFDPYCPKVLSGQMPLSDPALQTRFLTMNMAKAPQRSDGSAWSPFLPPAFDTEKHSLRVRLGLWAKANVNLDYTKVELPDGVESRQLQVFLPLYAVTPTRHREALDRLSTQHADYVSRETSDNIDVEVVQALIDMGSPSEFKPGQLADRLNEQRDSDDQVSAKFVAVALRRMGFERKGHTRTGNPFKADDEQIAELALSLGVRVAE